MTYLPVKADNQTLGPSKFFPLSCEKLAGILLRLPYILYLYLGLLKIQNWKNYYEYCPAVKVYINFCIICLNICYWRKEVMKNLKGKMHRELCIALFLQHYINSNNRKKLFCHETYWQLLPEVPTGADCGLSIAEGAYKMFVQFALLFFTDVHNCLENHGAWYL